MTIGAPQNIKKQIDDMSKTISQSIPAYTKQDLFYKNAPDVSFGDMGLKEVDYFKPKKSIPNPLSEVPPGKLSPGGQLPPGMEKLMGRMKQRKSKKGKSKVKRKFDLEIKIPEFNL